MLKNNQERENYFRDDHNWCPCNNSYYGYVNVLKLRNYPIIRITAHVHIADDIKECTLGYYEYSKGLNALDSIYNKTLNQCIAIMREVDNNA